MTLRSNETFKISLKLYSYLNYLIYNNQIYIYIYIYLSIYLFSSICNKYFPTNYQCIFILLYIIVS